MSLRTTELETAAGQSLVHLATNVVGVMIILAMVAGARSQLPTAAVAPENPAALDDLAATRRSAETLEGDVHRLAAEIETIKAEAAGRMAERDRLSLLLAAADHELAERRASLDVKSRAEFDLQRDLALAKADLDRLAKERQQLTDTPEKTVKVENYPAPIGRTVDDKEAHFQLRRGRIAYVPINESMAKLKRDGDSVFRRIGDLPELTETFGPIDGFLIRYHLERVEIPWDETVQSGRTGAIIQLSKIEFLPTSGQLGEPLEAALSNKSVFRGRLDDMPPKRFTITLWVYPDSFEEFRRLRKELYHLGYAIAARPMPEGLPIGGSSQGSKSTAE